MNQAKFWFARLTAPALFCVALGVYILTLCPTVYWDDSGELIAAAYTLGIPHPPGHPLYAIIGHLFTLLPFGSVAFRVNLMSAFFGALTCYLIYKIICDLLGDSPWREAAAFAGAMFFAFAPTVWDQTTAAETTTLHSFFMMLLTLLAFRLASGETLWKNEQWSLCLFTFLYGLSETNHVAGVFFFPAFVYLLIVTFKKRIFVPKLLLVMAAAFFTGMLVYAYLPIRAHASPAINWGNPRNLQNFLWVITARQYAPNLVTRPSGAAVLGSMIARGTDLLHQFTAVGCAFGLAGFVGLYRKQKRFLAFSLIVIAVLAYVEVNKAFISAYFVPALGLMAVWIGVGIQEACGCVCRLSGRIKPVSSAVVVRRATCGTLALSFLLPLGFNVRDMDRSHDFYAHRYGELLLKSLPPDTAFFTVDGYALFILWYLKYCENKRPDLMVIEPSWVLSGSALRDQMLQQHPDLALPPEEIDLTNASSMDEFTTRKNLAIQAVMDANYGTRPVYWGVISRNLPFFRNLIPKGIVFEYLSAPNSLDDSAINSNKEFWESQYDLCQRDPRMKKDKVSQEIYPVELNNQGIMFEELHRDDLCRWATELALKFNPDYPTSRYNLARLEEKDGDNESALREYKLAIKGDPNMAIAYYGLGNAYRAVGRFDEAFLAYRKATHLKPNYFEALTAMGQMYSLAGQQKDAEEKFQQALKVEPFYPFALRGLLSVYLETNQLDKARQCLDSLTQISPDSAPTLYSLAQYNAHAGKMEEAASALKRSIEIGGNAYLSRAKADKCLKELVQNLPPDIVSKSFFK